MTYDKAILKEDEICLHKTVLKLKSICSKAELVKTLICLESRLFICPTAGPLCTGFNGYIYS